MRRLERESALRGVLHCLNCACSIRDDDDYVFLHWQVVFDAQLASIKGFRTAGGAVPRLEVLPLAQRYAALTASLLVLSAEYEVRAHTCLRLDA